ncbi:MAG TPA: hypothetical protein VMR28_03050 [Candidatus Saccharimonadales bacterium]|nr:hypothetical protein [Candidatus Saccharimonadales bacterium]
MTKKYFIQQFPDPRQDKLRRRKRFTKHYEVKMRLKQVWYRNPKLRPSH